VPLGGGSWLVPLLGFEVEADDLGGAFLQLRDITDNVVATPVRLQSPP
jgi:hypothetical protein